jgi:hypothetical protein
MKYITIRKYPFKGFYVVDTKTKCADYCRWNLFLAIETFIWYLGVNPKYAFLHLRIKKIFIKCFGRNQK